MEVFEVNLNPAQLDSAAWWAVHEWLLENARRAVRLLIWSEDQRSFSGGAMVYGVPDVMPFAFKNNRRPGRGRRAASQSPYDIFPPLLTAPSRLSFEDRADAVRFKLFLSRLSEHPS